MNEHRKDSESATQCALISSDDAATSSALAEIRHQLEEMVRHQENANAIIVLLLARVGDPAHVSIDEAALIMKRLIGRGSPVTVRRMISRGELTLETVPGTRNSGIPIQQLYARWIDIRAARTAVERELKEINGTTR